MTVQRWQCSVMPSVYFKLWQGAEKESYADFTRSWFFWVFFVLNQQINTARGMKVWDESMEKYEVQLVNN
jgi:hypothetical protein